MLGKGGEVVACIGVRECGEGHGHSWAMFAESSRGKLFSIHKHVSRYLRDSGYSTIWADVRESYGDGHRWAKLLGFKSVSVEEDYYEDGTNAVMYRRDRI